ncbi:MAG TPA: hypothetical protein VK074_12500, partial [Fodinibius sp.]|nr:hypothetical protein [Fodinibius sp.]
MENTQNSNNWLGKIARGAAFSIGAAAAAAAVSKWISSPRELRLKNKVILITGGGRGLGLILARKLSAYGARIVICGRS